MLIEKESLLDFFIITLLLNLIWLGDIVNDDVEVIALGWLWGLLTLDCLFEEFAVSDGVELVRLSGEFQVVGDQQNSLSLQQLFECFLEEERAHVRIHRAEDIVEQKDIGVAVEGSCEGDSDLLSSGNGAAPLAD